MVNDLKHQEILVAFDDKTATRYPSFWLRDQCRCSECMHPHTKQRQINTFDIDPDIRVQDADAKATAEGLEIIWPENHRSQYSWDWLRGHVPFSAAPSNEHVRGKWQHIAPHSPRLPTVDYGAVMNSEGGLREYLGQIRTYGLSFVRDTPATPEATEQLLNRISFIRPTHYGAFWDFTSKPNPVDTAYTNLGLPNHTDNTYFTDPCGLQMFHCLQAGEGGESTFVDGFAAAAHLYKVNPDYYNILSSIRVVSHASGDSQAGNFMNNTVHPAGFPVFTHATPHIKPHPKHITQIRWNNDDRHSMTQWPSHERMIMWYRAARVWSDLLASKDFEITVKLEPGTPVIFDNWRTLHGRKAFEGQRRICGGYINMDDFIAKCRAVGLQDHTGIEVMPENIGDKSEEERENEEKVKQEQIQEEEIAEREEGNVEPEVVPQKDQGMDRPFAS